MNQVTYYHVKLPQHDVVLAEGLPTESFLDMKDGSNYANRPGGRRGCIRTSPPACGRHSAARRWSSRGRSLQRYMAWSRTTRWS